jgi:hypothetical protein
LDSVTDSAMIVPTLAIIAANSLTLMANFFTLVGHFMAASLLTFFLASTVHSQFVLAGLSEIGVVMTLSDRLWMTWQDLLGLWASLGPIISISLLLGFASCRLLCWQIQALSAYRIYLLPLAGASAVACMLLAMHPIMNITVIAGARTTLGFLGLCLCGAAGGSLFYFLRPSQTR